MSFSEGDETTRGGDKEQDIGKLHSGDDGQGDPSLRYNVREIDDPCSETTDPAAPVEDMGTAGRLLEDPEASCSAESPPLGSRRPIPDVSNPNSARG